MKFLPAASLALVLAWPTVGLGPTQNRNVPSRSRVGAGHPRLFLRPDTENGLNLSAFRRRANDPRYQRFIPELKGSLPNLALRGLLTGDSAATDQAIEMLKRHFNWNEITTDEGVELCFRAMAFDWLFDRISQSVRESSAQLMVDGADRLIRELESGGHVFHTRMYGWATGITLAGLALDGHHPEAPRLWKYGSSYYRERLLPARRLQDGSVHNGFGYGRKYTMWMTGHFLSCWLSATGEDLWAEIRKHQDDWARREMLFLIYGRYPDGSHLRFGDSYSLQSDAFSFRAVAERVAAYRDPVGQAFLSQLLREAGASEIHSPKVRPPLFDSQNAYTYFIFFDPELPEVSPATLPTKALFSRHGTGMVVWKTGWGRNDTTVFFKCGDYFENHGHFDQGHLDVFRRVPLLIDSGSYLTFSGRFRTAYWHRTVAHNSVLISDPQNRDDGGQRVFSSQSDASLEEYRRNPLVETGTILNYDTGPDWAYVAGDYTAAYPRDRARKISRELTLLEDRFLVVMDRVETARADLVPTVLWHCPVEPGIDPSGSVFQVLREGASARVQVLAPEGALLRWVEGFRAAGERIEPTGELRGLKDMGVGRVEVSEASGQQKHLFVHVIDIADAGTPPVAAECRIEREAIRLRIGARALQFRVDRPSPPRLR